MSSTTRAHAHFYMVRIKKNFNRYVVFGVSPRAFAAMAENVFEGVSYYLAEKNVHEPAEV